MTAPRSMKEVKQFYKFQREDAELDVDCTFCAIKKGDAVYIDETRYMKIIRNRLPYSIWDGQGVVDHLMILPKQHTEKLGDLGPEAAFEYIKLVDKYESDGYNLYARAPNSSLKSIIHQHSHLIKLDGKDRQFLFMAYKPRYIRLSK